MRGSRIHGTLGDGLEVADGKGLAPDAAGGPDGVALGSVVWSQIGMFELRVRVGCGEGVLAETGTWVGSGTGGTRGSGNRGSAAAERVCEFFQSEAYEDAD